MSVARRIFRGAPGLWVGSAMADSSFQVLALRATLGEGHRHGEQRCDRPRKWHMSFRLFFPTSQPADLKGSPRVCFHPAVLYAHSPDRTAADMAARAEEDA